MEVLKAVLIVVIVIGVIVGIIAAFSGSSKPIMSDEELKKREIAYKRCKEEALKPFKALGGKFTYAGIEMTVEVLSFHGYGDIPYNGYDSSDDIWLTAAYKADTGLKRETFNGQTLKVLLSENEI